MNRRSIMNKFSGLIILAFVIALSFFIVSLDISNYIIDRKSDGKTDERIVEDLREYVLKRQLSSDSRKQLWGWCKTREVDIEVFVDGHLIFSSIFDTQNNTFNIEESERNKERAHQISFNDRTADVVFYPYMHMYDQVKSLDTAAAVLLFFAVIFIGMRSELEYIHLLNEEIQVLEGGDLTREITVKGDSEITMLAESVNEFRKGMQAQLKTIEQLEKSNRRMSAEIAHDLRTPLTSLIMYLDFAQKEIEGKEPMAEGYLTKAREKSIRLKNLLDQNYNYTTMQDYFLIEKQKILAYEVLSGYIGDILTHLEGEGFHVRADVNYGNSTIVVQREGIGRVFSNIVSNITKYGKRDAEVFICCKELKDYVEIRFVNAVRVFEEGKPDSTGFGVRIVKRLMEEMDGEYIVEESNGFYTSKLRFLKV